MLLFIIVIIIVTLKNVQVEKLGDHQSCSPSWRNMIIPNLMSWILKIDLSFFKQKLSYVEDNRKAEGHLKKKKKKDGTSSCYNPGLWQLGPNLDLF